MHRAGVMRGNCIVCLGEGSGREGRMDFLDRGVGKGGGQL